MSALNVKNYIHVEVNGVEQARTFTVTDAKNDGGFTVTIQKTKNRTDERGNTTIDFDGFQDAAFPSKQAALEHVKAEVQTFLAEVFKTV